MNREDDFDGHPVAEMIFYGGDIITVDTRHPSAEALAVLGGKIVAVGSKQDAGMWQGANTQMIDLQGKSLMPGLIEPHSHPIGSALLYDWVDISGFTHATGEAMIETLRQAVAKAKRGQWIFGFGFDPILIRDLSAVDANFLDQISTSNPIFLLLQSMHTAFVNHKAFEVVGITNETAQPGRGAQFVKDAAGNLTGMLIEAGAMMPFLAHAASRSYEENLSLVKKQFERYAHAGITTVGVTGLLRLLPRADELLLEAAKSEDSPVRICHYHATHYYPGENQAPFSGDDRFRYLGTKYWIDGSPYTGTMFLDEPYLNSELMQVGLGIKKDTVGHYMIPKAKMQQYVQRDHDTGVQISIHCQGDRAVRDTIDIYQEVLEHSPRADHRHRIEHVALGSKKALQRAAQLGVTPSFHINHIYYYGKALRDEIIGPERAHCCFPIGTAKRLGHRISLHADSPMFPANPLLLMRTAVTRQTREGDVIGAEEAITVDDAIKGVTIDAAWQLFLEEKVGTLSVGKLADLVVLSHNPRKVAPDKLDQIQVIETYLGGRRVKL